MMYLASAQDFHSRTHNVKHGSIIDGFPIVCHNDLPNGIFMGRISPTASAPHCNWVKNAHPHRHASSSDLTLVQTKDEHCSLHFCRVFFKVKSSEIPDLTKTLDTNNYVLCKLAQLWTVAKIAPYLQRSRRYTHSEITLWNPLDLLFPMIL